MRLRRAEPDKNGNERRLDPASGRTLRRGNCAVCKRCWIWEDTGHCLYGGPYTGFVNAGEEPR